MMHGKRCKITHVRASWPTWLENPGLCARYRANARGQAVHRRQLQHWHIDFRRRSRRGRSCSGTTGTGLAGNRRWCQRRRCADLVYPLGGPGGTGHPARPARLEIWMRRTGQPEAARFCRQWKRPYGSAPSAASCTLSGDPSSRRFTAWKHTRGSPASRDGVEIASENRAEMRNAEKSIAAGL